MRIFRLMIIILSLVFVIKCGDKGTSKSDPGKEIARIFFLNEPNIDTEEIAGDLDNRITCKLVGTLGPGIRVIVKDENNRSFRMDFHSVRDPGFVFRDGYAQYIDENGTPFESNENALKNVEISWRENLDFCEFTFKAQQSAIQLTSTNNADVVLVDSIRIETLREDDL